MVPILLRTSERGTFKECRQKWQWGYEDRLRKVGTESTALRFGTLVHASLAAYYVPGKRRGPHPAATYRQLYTAQLAAGMDPMRIKKDEEYGSPSYVDPIDFGVGILDHYIDTYGKDQRYQIIKPEQDFQLDIQHPRSGRYLFTYVSEMDAVVRDLDTGRLGLFEHKTSATTDPFGAPLALDEQASAYWTFGTMWLHATGQLKTNQDLDFMLYNFIRKALPDLRPKDAEGRSLNKNGSISKVQPAPYFRRETVMRGAEEREVVFRRVLNEFREMQMVREGKLAVYKSPGRHCGFCQFRDMCEVHECGSDWEAMRDGMYTTWDPYAAHEIGMRQ